MLNFLFIFLSAVAFSEPDLEKELMIACGNKDTLACEHLGTLYLGRSDWTKAFMISEALCEKESAQGCMMAGTSLMAQGRVREGSQFLTKACDQFEPLSCRSLGRLMTKSGEEALGAMYFKRSCIYGYKGSCEEVKGLTYSLHAQNFLKNLDSDCRDTNNPQCQTYIQTLQSCALPLTQLDCRVLAGFLSIYFRAKFMQQEAKIVLTKIYEAEMDLKSKAKFYYDIELVQKSAKPLEKYHYVFGFIKHCGKGNKTDSRQLYANAYRHYGPRARLALDRFFRQGSIDDCYSSKTGFQAYAVANLDPMNPDHLDVWRIDHERNLENISSGLPLP